MTALHLDSLEIKNFRAFKHLTIEKLGRVNLIVGKNSVGKTALLEALWLYAARRPSLVWEILQRHDEAGDIELLESQTEKGTRYRVDVSKHLFHGRVEPFTEHLTTEIGSMHSLERHFSLTALWTRAIETEKLVTLREVAEASTYNPAIPGFSIDIDGTDNQLYLIDRTARLTKPIKPFPHVFLGSEGLTVQLAENWWNQVALTEREDVVIQALNIIDPNIQRIAFINRSDTTQTRYPLVRMTNNERTPLRSLGDGLNQLFYVILALVNAESGFCLVDEIETGLHYTTMYPLWELIFRIAKELNIQVFATTHSDDCVRAFQDAAQANEQVAGQLIRLERWNDKHTAIVLDEKDLEASVKYNIETR